MDPVTPSARSSSGLHRTKTVPDESPTLFSRPRSHEEDMDPVTPRARSSSGLQRTKLVSVSDSPRSSNAFGGCLNFMTHELESSSSTMDEPGPQTPKARSNIGFGMVDLSLPSGGNGFGMPGMDSESENDDVDDASSPGPNS